MSHTPGPWLMDDESNVFADNVAVALCSRSLTRRAWIECERNARLIAAAPDLFDALRHIATTAEVSAVRHAHSDAGDSLLHLHRVAAAALTKAEGK